ncbi:MAG TPA: 16S rRNA (guanine(527)-N(7))-methyltransferase RsmG [Tepidisphaeraceae bacterium]|nr:16S rRNA (guanine(527)-N(7))-methyltransferase RsmG [Tepidisphaeraceae bacterium]
MTNTLWSELAGQAGFPLSDAQLQLLSRYLDLLLEINKVMNLTRIENRAEAEVLHVGDSLTVLPFLPREAHQLVDVGSGGGVPGIPLAIARPDVQVTLIESTKKKAAFLEKTAKELGLANVKALAERAEVIAHGPKRDSFDIATARAVGAMNMLVEWCLPLVKKGGKLLAMKGARIAEELPAAEKAIHLLSGGTPVIHPITLPGTESHVLVEIPKLGRTDARYPRSPSQAKKPL